MQTSRCYFFWPVLIFGKSTRKTGKNTRKQAKNRRFFGANFLWEKLVGANFYAFCNYAMIIMIIMVIVVIIIIMVMYKILIDKCSGSR